MTFNSSYAVLRGENEFPHTDLAAYYTQSTTVDPILGPESDPFAFEAPQMQRYLEEEEHHRLWEPSNWPETFPMGMQSYPATPTLESNATLESNDRSSTSSPESPLLLPNNSHSVTQTSLQRYREPSRPLTPLASGIFTSAPDAFSEVEYPTPRVALTTLSTADEPQERVGNTIHVQPPGQAASFRASLGPSPSPFLPLKEQNQTKASHETIHPISLMSPPMPPQNLPTRPHNNKVNGVSNLRNITKIKKEKDSIKVASPNKVTKPRQRSTSSSVKGGVKLNFTRNYTNTKFIPVSQHTTDSQCPHCDFSCKDHPTLDKHIKSEHARPFTCIFHFAGCSAKFAAKNEWKRHVISQHVVLRVYNCTLESCAKAKGIPGRSQTTYVDMMGKQFNRKDLYDSHMRRMHPYPATKKLSLKDWENKRQALLEDSIHDRCKLPTYMECPNPKCNNVFEGEDAWDQRMEHMARHMEMAAAGEAAEVAIGGDEDHTLLDWASSEDVGVIRRSAGSWKVCYPGKEKNSVRVRSRRR